MKKLFILASLILSIGSSAGAIYSQGNGSSDAPKPPPPATKPTPPRLSNVLAANLSQLPKGFETSRENREKAYTKLLEGQRYIWSMRRLSSITGIETAANSARQALVHAIELNPNLAEAYTGLAELAINVTKKDIEESIGFAKIATKLDNDNFGGHRLLGRLYTLKSDLDIKKIDSQFSYLAISEWKEIIRLDSRNAEAWAFLSAFYKETDQNEKRIDALRNWLTSSTPLDDGFYNAFMNRDGGLSVETASIKLGQALIETGKNDEALSVLTRAVSDSPNNLETIELLSQTLENAEGNSLFPAIEALRQAVYANPDNLSLNELLAKTIARSGNLDDAVKFLNEGINRSNNKNKVAATSFLITLGDIYADANRVNDAIASYRKALQIRGINDQQLFSEDERDFALLVISKMIEAYKNADLSNEAKDLIEQSRSLFGDDDLTLDREYIKLLRSNGKKNEALKTIRSARVISPTDYNLIRTEASVLTDLGKVDEAVSLIKNLIDKKPVNVAPSIMYDDFTNYLFISSLYIQSKRDDDAIKVATKAIEVAKGKESKQIAQMTLASAQQSAGDFESAEKLLRQILVETPENPFALNNLGYLFLESGKNYDEALKLINKAVQIDPTNPSYLDSLGWAFYKLKRYSEAEKYLLKAIRYDSTSSTIYEHLGDVYKQNGKMEEAKNAWKKALSFSANTVDFKRIESKLTQ